MGAVVVLNPKNKFSCVPTPSEIAQMKMEELETDVDGERFASGDIPWNDGREPALTTLAGRRSYKCTPDFLELKDKWWKVFVYGTLKKSFYNHELLKNMPYLGRAHTIPGAFGMYSAGSFPVLGPSIQKASVEGELYAVDVFCLMALDRLEGNGMMYNRQKHWVNALDQQSNDRKGVYTDCFMYVGDKSYWDFDLLPTVDPLVDKGKFIIEW